MKTAIHFGNGVLQAAQYKIHDTRYSVQDTR